MTIRTLNARASDVMSSPAVTVRPTATLAEAAALMIDRNIGCLPVTDPGGTLVGMLTERMLQAQVAGVRPASTISFQNRTVLELYVGHPGQLDPPEFGIGDFRKRTVREAMADRPIAVDADAPLWKVADLMMKDHVSHLPVSRGQKLVGVIARHDLVRAMAERSAPGGA